MSEKEVAELLGVGSPEEAGMQLGGSSRNESCYEF